MRIGIHTSIAKSLEQSARKAASLGANTFQIFSASPRMWRCSMPDTGDCGRLQAARAELDLSPLVIHGSYLINLASAEEGTRARSIQAFRGELERAIAIGAECLVVHPGSYKGQEIPDAIVRVAGAIAAAAVDLPRDGLTLLLENTAGQGATLGSRFEELAAIRRHAADRTNLPIGYCIDTCHALAAGYDVATKAGLEQTVAALDRVLGLEHVPVLHANDSQGALGSHKDRHAHIGEGHIGRAGFRRILRHPALRAKAFILETPIEQDGDDQRNIDALKELCRSSCTSTKRSS